MALGLGEFLDDAATRAASSPLTISVRDLLAKWSARRRGYRVVARIRGDLESRGLTTTPDFNDVWIDSTVQIVPIREPAADTDGSGVAAESGTPPSVPTEREIYLRVKTLASANRGVISVCPQDTLQTAQALMMRHDYSQLPVLSGERDLRGAVSWESIAQARIRKADCALADATVPAVLVRDDDDLLAQIPQIVSHGYVFVQARDRRIVGIVTTADLSEAFATIANPFLMLGEIERQLRDVIDRTFTVEELAAAVNPADGTRLAASADDLSFGEYVRLLESPGNWDRLGWDFDRKVFIDALDEVREIRNDVMHFSPDPLEEDDLRKLIDFAQWLRKIRPPAGK